MKQVNKSASQQDEWTTILATEHQKRSKVNACEVLKEGGEQRARNPSSDRSQQILSEIRQMKSEIHDLKGRVNAQCDQVAKPNWGRPPYRGHGGGYQPKNPSWDCHSCEECGGGGYDDCFTCGSSGHVACECTSRRNLDLFFGYPVSWLLRSSAAILDHKVSSWNTSTC